MEVKIPKELDTATRIKGIGAESFYDSFMKLVEEFGFERNGRSTSGTGEIDYDFEKSRKLKNGT